MSMIDVKPALGAGGIPQEEVVRQLAMRRRQRGGVEGLGATWGDWLQNLATSWSSAGQQILINQNPATMTTTGPQGTTTYYPTSAVPGSTTAAASSGNAMIILAAGAVLLVIMMTKR